MRRRRRAWEVLIGPSAGLAVYLAAAASPALWRSVFSVMFPSESRLLYERSTMLELIGQHLVIVAVATAISVSVGLALGVFVTRPAGRDFLGVVSDMANFGQTFPPIAVLALSIPLLGLGFRPTVFALAVYGVLPVLQNTIAGIEAVPEQTLESARAVGLRPAQILWHVELPISAPVIFAGVRVSVVVAVATATIGATINAGGLGGPIISGLANFDPAVTLQGGVLAAGLALILDAYLAAAERLFGRTVSTRPRRSAQA